MRSRLLLLLLGAGACSSETSDTPDGGGAADAVVLDAGAWDAETGRDVPAGDRGAVEDSGQPPIDVSTLSDDFSGAALDPAWQVFQPDAVDVSLSGGELVLRLLRTALWFNDQRGVLIYKPVSGDFKLSAKVHARRSSDLAQPPTRMVHLGGLMARNGSSASENYVFIVVGFDEQDLSVETKSTKDSVSGYVGPSWPSGDAELRLCRVGPRFLLLKRPIGGASWEEAARHDRPDLPETLQVGPNIYSFSQPDLTVRFEEARFAPVRTEADCAAD